MTKQNNFETNLNFRFVRRLPDVCKTMFCNTIQIVILFFSSVANRYLIKTFPMKT